LYFSSLLVPPASDFVSHSVCLFRVNVGNKRRNIADHCTALLLQLWMAAVYIRYRVDIMPYISVVWKEIIYL